MKTYNELTPEQQAKAREKALNEALQHVAEGFDAWLDEFTLAKVKCAWVKAEEMHTPWFIGEYIMDTCRAEFEQIALQDASAYVYAERGDPTVVYGIADTEEARRLAGDKAEPSAEEKARRNDEQALALQIAAQGRKEPR